MIRSLGLSLALLSVVLLAGAAYASARSEREFVINPGPVEQFTAGALAVDLSEVAAHYTTSDIGYRNGDNTGGDHEASDRNSESPNILSFAAALLIGGVVLYSRRTRRGRK